jgi:hypothetical protein
MKKHIEIIRKKSEPNVRYLRTAEQPVLQRVSHDPGNMLDTNWRVTTVDILEEAAAMGIITLEYKEES